MLLVVHPVSQRACSCEASRPAAPMQLKAGHGRAAAPAGPARQFMLSLEAQYLLMGKPAAGRLGKSAVEHRCQSDSSLQQALPHQGFLVVIKQEESLVLR